MTKISRQEPSESKRKIFTGAQKAKLADEVYLKQHGGVQALLMGLTRYFQFYNEDQRQDCGKILRGDANIRSHAEELGQRHSAGV